MAFKWLQNILSRKGGEKEQAGDAVSASLGEARDLLGQASEDEVKRLLEEMEDYRQNALEQLREVEKAFEKLRSVVPEEPRAQASKNIKDSFADRALASVRSFHSDSAGDMQGYESFAKECQKLVAGTRISPKEAMHMKFFFDVEMREIAGAMKGFSLYGEAVLAALDRYGEKFSSALRLSKEIEQLQGQAIKKSEEAGMTERESGEILREADTMLSGITPVEGLDEALEEMLKADARLRQQEEAVNSIFYSISKTLRKYAYKIASKEEATLIGKYLTSPKTALVQDEDLLVCNMAKKSMQKAAELDLSEKEIERLQAFPSKEEIISMRKAVISLAQNAEDLKRKAQPLREQENANVEMKKNAAGMMQKVESMKREAEALKKAAENSKAAAQSVKEQFAEELGKILGKRIKIV